MSDFLSSYYCDANFNGYFNGNCDGNIHDNFMGIFMGILNDIFKGFLMRCDGNFFGNFFLWELDLKLVWDFLMVIFMEIQMCILM